VRNAEKPSDAAFGSAPALRAPMPANDNEPFDPPPAASLRAPRPWRSLTVALCRFPRVDCESQAA
jgi:hypothetical protein